MQKTLTFKGSTFFLLRHLTFCETATQFTKQVDRINTIIS